MPTENSLTESDHATGLAVVPPGSTWARSHHYQALGVVRPRSVDELCRVVGSSEKVRALGSRHSFTAVADTEGYLIDLGDLRSPVDVDTGQRCVWVSAASTYDQLANALEDDGWALPAMASLPHITVAGAVATGTHGSGDSVASLASNVRAVELVTADGDIRTIRRGQPDFDGHVVALGALGVVTRLALDIEPSFRIRQDVLLGLGWDEMAAQIDSILGSAYSVSVFTDWLDPDRTQVWLKSRVEQDGQPPSLEGTRLATAMTHMLRGGEVEALTPQLGAAGPWHERLPHFLSNFTPSRGDELQSEYLVPRRHAAAAVDAMRSLALRLGEPLARVLQCCEIRSVAADQLWLSGAYGEDVIGLHWTWSSAQDAVDALLTEIESSLRDFGARPHWGKCFNLRSDQIAGLFPRFDDFHALRDRLDPRRKFGNAYLRDRLGS